MTLNRSAGKFGANEKIFSPPRQIGDFIRIPKENFPIRLAGIGAGFQMNAGWPDYTRIKNGVCELTQDDARMSYATLWESINGPGSWDLNPLVWRVETKPFKK